MCTKNIFLSRGRKTEINKYSCTRRLSFQLTAVQESSTYKNKNKFIGSTIEINDHEPIKLVTPELSQNTRLLQVPSPRYRLLQAAPAPAPGT